MRCPYAVFFSQDPPNRNLRNLRRHMRFPCDFRMRFPQDPPKRNLRNLRRHMRFPCDFHMRFPQDPPLKFKKPLNHHRKKPVENPYCEKPLKLIVTRKTENLIRKRTWAGEIFLKHHLKSHLKIEFRKPTGELVSGLDLWNIRRVFEEIMSNIFRTPGDPDYHFSTGRHGNPGS